MPIGATLSEGSGGESIIHFASIRIRVNGAGELKMAVFSLDELKSKQMVPFVMKTLDRSSQTRIVNFVEQRASFELKTVNMNDKFRINRIVVFAKPIYSSQPGN